MPPIMLKLNHTSNLQAAIQNARSKGYQNLMSNIVNTEFIREFVDDSIAQKQLCFTRSPLALSSSDWSLSFSACINSVNIDVSDPDLAKNNERQFLQEIHFAQHLKHTGYIVVKLTTRNAEQLARTLQSSISDQFQGKILLQIDMVDPRKQSFIYRSDLTEQQKSDRCSDMWKVWNKFRSTVDFKSKFELALVLPADLPSDDEIYRWIGENVGLLIIPHSAFISNKSNYPILSTKHREVVQTLMQYTKCSIAIQPKNSRDPRTKLYAEFIEYISKFCHTDNVNNGFEDHLETPLQPLHDNLDTSVYEVFERDPVKYILYQKAIENAMRDKVPDEEIGSKKLIVMVVGAGRGPLVRAAINASKITGRQLKLLVVEKNPNAIVTLSHLINSIWRNEEITLISSDMRTLVLDEKVDIIISELLGSFGDNELSPECLDGAQKHLKSDGISIPCNSISYIRPVMSRKIYNNARDHGPLHTSFTSPIDDKQIYQNPLEVNWVVLFNNVYYIDKPKELFRFVHPNKDDPIDNTRAGTLQFTAKQECILHGFAGYFSSQLYKDISLSTEPSSHTLGMISWFPMFFPLCDPVLLADDATIEVNFQRKLDNQKVWYEWQLSAPKKSDWHNRDGLNHPIFKI